MIRIFTRSPHIVSVNDVSQTGSKVELYIYDGASSGPPTLPTYTLSKLIPGTGVTENLYNISPYLKEYLKHKSNGMNYNTVNDLTEYDEYTYVQYITYNLIGGTYILDQTVTARCYDGYGYFEELTNVDRGDILLGDGTKHYYWYDSANTPASIGAHRAGIVTAFLDRDWSVYRQNLLTGASQIDTYSFAGVYDLFRVFPTYYSAGNLMQIYDDLNVLQWEATFIPKTECRYEPMTIDFLNKFGGWQREFFFKASQELLDVTNTTYNLMMSDVYPMTLSEGQRGVFNANGIRRYIMNTGWVDESYGDTMQELLLSERVIWVYGTKRIPVKVNTKSINKQKNINNKTINYQIEIELAFDVIQTAI